LDRVARLPWPGSRRARLRLVSIPRESVAADADSQRLDEILQKICDSGRSSLSDEERAFLQRASARLKERPE
jgi:hypothetical protein